MDWSEISGMFSLTHAYINGVPSTYLINSYGVSVLELSFKKEIFFLKHKVHVLARF